MQLETGADRPQPLRCIFSSTTNFIATFPRKSTTLQTTQTSTSDPPALILCGFQHF